MWKFFDDILTQSVVITHNNTAGIFYMILINLTEGFHSFFTINSRNTRISMININYCDI